MAGVTTREGEIDSVKLGRHWVCNIHIMVHIYNVGHCIVVHIYSVGLAPCIVAEPSTDLTIVPAD